MSKAVICSASPRTNLPGGVEGLELGAEVLVEVGVGLHSVVLVVMTASGKLKEGMAL